LALEAWEAVAKEYGAACRCLHAFFIRILGTRTLTRPLPDLPLSSHHGVCDGSWAVSRREHAGFTERTEGAVVAEKAVDAGGVVDVVAGEFADGAGVGDEFVETDGAGGLAVGGGVLWGGCR